ncbi:MAG: hypothetical protein HFI75_08785 [Lachnospiraceae bacterium]|nr:hypothetical protein [Lachnospiraceae bacterium]
MRKIFFVFVALLWVVAGIQLIENLNQEDEGQIVQAFNKTNCMNAGSLVQASGQITDGYQTKEEQIKILERIAQELGIKGSYEISEEKEAQRSEVSLYREAAQAETRLRVISVENEISDTIMETSQYLLVEIQLYDKLECAVLYKENLADILRGMGITADISLQFSGEMQGSISQEERDSLVEHLLESISGKVCQKHEEAGVYTVYAYTDLVEEYQRINGRNINVTIAVTFDETKNRTKLYLATPLMKEDY